MHKRVFKRNDNKELFLYGNNQHNETSTKELEQTPTPEPHMLSLIHI